MEGLTQGVNLPEITVAEKTVEKITVEKELHYSSIASCVHLAAQYIRVLFSALSFFDAALG